MLKSNTNLLTVVDVDEDDEDEDDVEWEEGAEDIIDRKSQYEGNSVREIESHQRLRQMWEYVLYSNSSITDVVEHIVY